MRTLVTGAGGFVGRHLIRELVDNGHSVSAFEHPDAGPVNNVSETFKGDICDAGSVAHAVKSLQPEMCVHLAGIAFIPHGDDKPSLMLDVNTGGTINVLNAIKKHAPECRLLAVSTAHVYGPATGPDPIPEDHPLAPVSVYAISKAAADITTLSFARHHGLHAMTTRPHNHTGPGQSPNFVVPAFASQAKEIAAGRKEPVIKVGNLECERDFTDVRDVVRAYRLIIEKGTSGKAYNIASAEFHKIGDVLRKICKTAGIDPETKVDDALFRPTDRSATLDISALQKDTGWQPEISMDKTLEDIYATL